MFNAVESSGLRKLLYGCDGPLDCPAGELPRSKNILSQADWIAVSVDYAKVAFVKVTDGQSQSVGTDVDRSESNHCANGVDS